MTNKITLCGKAALYFLIVLGLNACTTLAALHRADNTTWSTPYLNQTECPNLDGAYEDRGKLNSPILTRLIADFHRRFENGSYSVQSYKPVPYEGLIGKARYEKQEIFFREDAVSEIRQSAPFVIEVTITDKRGTRYWRNVYKFEKMSSRFTVGCYQGALVIRKVTVTSGEHTPAARIQANETHFRRLESGDLQVIDTERTWNPASELPRTQTITDVFKLYRS